MAPPAEGDVAAAGAVVVHYRREHELDRLLERLTSYSLVADRIVVVDNGSDPERFGPIERRYPRVTFAHLENPGYGAAVNVGFAQLAGRADVVTVLTHEVDVSEDCLSHLVDALREDPGIGQIGPLLLDARHRERVWSTGGRVSRRRRRPSNRFRGREVAELEVAGLGPDVQWLDGAVFAMRQSDHRAIGGLAEEYWLYLEDVDLGWRLRTRLGRRVVCDLSVTAAQEPGGTLGDRLVYLVTRNFLWLVRRQGEWLAVVLFVAEMSARACANTVLHPRASRDKTRMRVRGLREGLFDYPFTTRDGG